MDGYKLTFGKKAKSTIYVGENELIDMMSMIREFENLTIEKIKNYKKS
jgi:predicted SPOUT superfamily RNA methylase MTH1